MNRELLQEEESIWFCIADNFMEVIVPCTLDWEQLLPSFKPFNCHSPERKIALCSIRVVEQPIAAPTSSKVLSEVLDVLGHRCCLKETEEKYVFDIQIAEKGYCSRMVSDKTFSTATVYLDSKDDAPGVLLSSCLMITFAQSAVLCKTLLIHSSVIEKDGKGYGFLGKSGTGKSTHSSLWLRYIEGSSLLNDDNPAIRVNDNGVYVYGTPWSGKTPCYKQRKVELKALVRLEQAPKNRFEWKEGVDALISFLPSCSSMRWNTLLYTKMCNTLEEVINKVGVGYLECLPNKDAALMCYKEVKQI